MDSFYSYRKISTHAWVEHHEPTIESEHDYRLALVARHVVDGVDVDSGDSGLHSTKVRRQMMGLDWL